ncbi:MAG: AAA family ATPase [Burkholderiaceae bacterium]
MAAQVGDVVVGKQSQIRLALACLLARGHLLIEDVPGVGKTTLAHALSISLGLEFKRIQFTNDLLPADIVGVNVFDRNKAEFVFHPGPVFSPVLLADEINRATPRTQSALLEAMEERDFGRRAPDATARALLRDRDPESAGSDRHLRAARITARPLSDVHRTGLSGPEVRARLAGGRRSPFADREAETTDERG